MCHFYDFLGFGSTSARGITNAAIANVAVCHGSVGGAGCNADSGFVDVVHE